MMIDFAIKAERDQGLSSREAIHRACLLRFRPILMTTLAAMLGGLPLALGHGSGSELRRPLGVAIAGGQLLSQLLTLSTTPVPYLELDRLTRRRRRAAGAPQAVAGGAASGSKRVRSRPEDGGRRRLLNHWVGPMPQNR